MYLYLRYISKVSSPTLEVLIFAYEANQPWSIGKRLFALEVPLDQDVFLTNWFDGDGTICKLRYHSLPIRAENTGPNYKAVPRFGEFRSCCCLPLLPQLA